MSIHPTLHRLIKKSYQNGFSKLHEFSAEEMRRYLKHPKFKTTQASYIDIQTDKAITLRCYTPTLANKKPLPALFYISANAFVLDRINESNDYCSELANQLNMKVINIAHRLAPEHKFPRFLYDCVESIEWLATQAHQYNINPNKFAIWGESSGGTIAASTTHIFKTTKNPLIKHQTLFYPMVDLVSDFYSKEKYGYGYMLDKTFIKWLDDRGFEPAQDRSHPLASPLLSTDFTNLPPATIITAKYDPLRDEGEAYVKKLTQAGIPTYHKRFDTMIHGFMRFYNKIDETLNAMRLACNQIKIGLNHL